MFDRFTKDAARAMHLASEEAHQFGHKYLGTEHILLGILRESSGVGAQVLRNLGVDSDRVRGEIEKLVNRCPKPISRENPLLSQHAKNALDQSLREATALHDGCIGTEHLLLAIIRDEDCTASRALVNAGVEFEDVRKEVEFFVV